MLLAGAEVPGHYGVVYREGCQGVLKPGVEKEVALPVVLDEGLQVFDLVEAVLAVVLGWRSGHSFLKDMSHSSSFCWWSMRREARERELQRQVAVMSSSL